MRNGVFTLLFTVLLLPQPAAACVTASAAPEVAGTATAAPPQVTEAAPASARVWQGREVEFEAFIASAPIDRFEDIPVGVTHPRRAFFKPGGLADSVAWKVLPTGRPNGYWESYKSEIAAYELDKCLGLGMVPVAVEKQWKHEVGAAILWLSPVRSWKDVQFRPKPPSWDLQMIRMKMFDNLVGNSDRNLGNLLVDASWNVFLIDHSRAFVTSKNLPAKFMHIDRSLWMRMRALDEAAVNAAIGKWVDRAAVQALLARRDRLGTAIEALVRKNGEGAVFVN